ncbi:MAG TPA: hypothetical protein VJZ78_07360 [Anaerolineales bacterium]|nr:hypothetical protein [Anaerolineales bacterium]
MARITINKQAPDFILKDFTGEAIQLSSFQPSWNVLLVFNRGFT